MRWDVGFNKKRIVFFYFSKVNDGKVFFIRKILVRCIF